MLTYLSNGKCNPCRASSQAVRSEASVRLLSSRWVWAITGTGGEASVTALDAPPSEDTRARILDVALELFAEKGFAATATRELAERLGFTKAALYYHFRTKDDLLAALITPAVDELTRLVTQADLRASTAARRTVLSAYVDYVIAYRELIRVITQDPAVAHEHAPSGHAELYRRLTQLLSGHDAPDTTEQTRVRAALGGIRAALLYTDPDADPAEVYAATIAAACGALGIPGPRPTTTRGSRDDGVDPTADN
jgi:AcrR family transcriptional regulator